MTFVCRMVQSDRDRIWPGIKRDAFLLSNKKSQRKVNHFWPALPHLTRVMLACPNHRVYIVRRLVNYVIKISDQRCFRCIKLLCCFQVSHFSISNGGDSFQRTSWVSWPLDSPSAVTTRHIWRLKSLSSITWKYTICSSSASARGKVDQMVHFANFFAFSNFLLDHTL